MEITVTKVITKFLLWDKTDHKASFPWYIKMHHRMTYDLLAKLSSIIQKHCSQSMKETTISECYYKQSKISSFYKAGKKKDENWTMPEVAMTNQARKNHTTVCTTSSGNTQENQSITHVWEMLWDSWVWGDMGGLNWRENTKCHKLCQKSLRHSWLQAGITTKGNLIKGLLFPSTSLHRHQLLATVKSQPYLVSWRCSHVKAKHHVKGSWSPRGHHVC